MITKMFSLWNKPRICCFLLSIAAFSCTERIEINTSDAPSQLVIYGYITSDAKAHSIRITRSAGYFSTDSPASVSDALVCISDNDGNIFHLHESPDEAGTYLTADNIRGEAGKSYTLDVQIDAQHYRASARMPHINDIDSVKLRVSTFSEDFVELLVFAEDFPENNFYSIFVSINDSVVNSTIERFRVMQNIRNGTPCYFLRQNQSSERDEDEIILRHGDKVTLNINAISREYADFISAAQAEISISIPIFSGPPANVPTNIASADPQNPALGFFAAFPSKYAEVVFK